MILTSSQQSRISPWLHKILVGLLVLSVWHVATHDINIASDHASNEECQICRLNHIPTTDGATVLAQIVPLVLLSFIPITSIHQHYLQLSLYTLGARAPPQS